MDSLAMRLPTTFSEKNEKSKKRTTKTLVRKIENDSGSGNDGGICDCDDGCNGNDKSGSNDREVTKEDSELKLQLGPFNSSSADTLLDLFNSEIVRIVDMVAPCRYVKSTHVSSAPCTTIENTNKPIQFEYVSRVVSPEAIVNLSDFQMCTPDELRKILQQVHQEFFTRAYSYFVVEDEKTGVCFDEAMDGVIKLDGVANAGACIQKCMVKITHSFLIS
ncbi:hypothetical protein HELRODRAFT_168954 [Helobdella robusta]|uniref:Uncharacterized protein n=1 Tax=Helobdella robusta TaxID=6412 RepID=T1F169_HELRO|nr:hypothetical protein HELRODRAFT_168954 [Helobdella robusta]ESO09022.1 hypothetical protein HELRODRAFT_168954 [Helobdella robusta]